MNTTINLRVLCLLLLLQSEDVAYAQQPVRLWSYARYSTNNLTGATQISDTGRFFYSGLRGLTFDSTLEYFFYRVPTSFQMNSVPDDFPNLNQWYTHRYQTVAPRLVAQFDSFNSWAQYTGTFPPNLQRNYSTRKRHSADRLDSMRLTVYAGTQSSSSAYDFTYDQSGRPETCRIESSDTIFLTRDGAGRVVRKDGEYISPSVEPFALIYHYNVQGLLDTVTVKDESTSALIRRDVLEYDLLERLRIVRNIGPNPPSFILYADRDSFTYDGTSNRCTDIYQFFDGNPSMNSHHRYGYDADGRLAYYARNGNLTRTFQRNSAGFVTQITETTPPTAITSKTYFYYDSLGAVGVHESPISVTTLDIHPNPATNQFFLQSAKPMSAYRLHSITGQEVKSGALSGTHQSISLEGLPPGAYVLYVQHKDGSRQVAQVMKR